MTNGHPILPDLVTANANGRTAAAVPPRDEGAVLDAAAVALQQRMRFNPLRMLSAESLSAALDAFDSGLLRQAALLWEKMAERDDTIPSVKGLREESCASQDWQDLPVPHADQAEAARHAAAANYFYANLTAVNAFDRNDRGGFARMVSFLLSAASYRYAVFHVRWQPRPGVMIEVPDAAPVPALTAEVEFVPLWFFENTTGTLRFLPDGGFGAIGRELDWESGEWFCARGPGVMIPVSISYLFKRLTFQDWTLFNERYAQGKVLGRTREAKDSAAGRAMANLVASFNGDLGAVLFGDDGSIADPLTVIEPTGNSAETFEKFVDRQDRKMTVNYLGQDLSTMSRGGHGGAPVVGASLHGKTEEKVEQADVRMVEGALAFLDRKRTEFVFGLDAMPLVQRRVPKLNQEDAGTVRENAGFLADRGAKVSASQTADRLGVTLTEDDEDVLHPVQAGAKPGAAGPTPPDATSTANAAALLAGETDARLRRSAAIRTAQAVAQDLAPVRERMEAIAAIADGPLQQAGLHKLLRDLPALLTTANVAPAAAVALRETMTAAVFNGFAAGEVDTLLKTANYNPHHGKDGRFAAGDAGGGSGGSGGGGGGVRAWAADASAGVISPTEARARLQAGIHTHDVFGHAVTLDEHVLNHWDAEGHSAAAQDRRLRRLPDAVRAIETPHEVWQQGKQKAYLRAFEDERSKRRYTAGFVVESGRARTFFHFERATEANKIRKGDRIYERP